MIDTGELREEVFCGFVRDTIAKHPDWIDSTIAAIKQGAVARVQVEIDRRADADTAICFVLSTESGRRAMAEMDEVRRKSVLDSINAGSFGGTPWAKSLTKERSNAVC